MSSRVPVAYVAAGCALAVLAVLVLVKGVDRGEDPTRTAAPQATVSVSDPVEPASVTPETSSTKSPTGRPVVGDDGTRIAAYPYGEVKPRGTVPVAVLEPLLVDTVPVAQAGIETFYSTTWRDEGPASWVDRMKPIATDRYLTELRREAAGLEVTASWDELVASRFEQKVEFSGTPIISDWYGHNGTLMTLVVDHVVSSGNRGTWTSGSGQQLFVRVRMGADGGWLVDDVRPFDTKEHA